jgi:hypothetical protein
MDKMGLSKILTNLGLTDDRINVISKETGFILRNRVIQPEHLLTAICNGSLAGTVSLNDTAAKIEADDGVSVTKGAIGKKMTPECEAFFKEILSQVIREKISYNAIKKVSLNSPYERIVIQDSTIIKLPSWLFDDFSGVSNGHAKVCNARIQFSFDVLAGNMLSFSIDPYSKNDLKAAVETTLNKGDLTLRDRGYLTYDEVQRHIDSDAHCIYRYKYKASFLDPDTKEKLDILSLLEVQNGLDMEVLLNNENETPVRLVAEPVCKEIANNRRRKAKHENKSTPSKDYLKMLSWSIFITTIPAEEASYEQIFQTYGLRWRVENMFKCWKSNMAFDKIHRVSAIQLSILILARFIMITIYMQHLFEPYRILIKDKLDKDLSLFKFVRYLIANKAKTSIIIADLEKNTNGENLKTIARYCSYEQRNRPNFRQKLEELIS